MGAFNPALRPYVGAVVNVQKFNGDVRAAIVTEVVEYSPHTMQPAIVELAVLEPGKSALTPMRCELHLVQQSYVQKAHAFWPLQE